jgi:hypothetical protein
MRFLATKVVLDSAIMGSVYVVGVTCMLHPRASVIMGHWCGRLMESSQQSI